MAETVTLAAESRTGTGTSAARKLRRQGIVPGNIFGHKQDSQSIQLQADAVRDALAKGVQLVDLTLGGSSEKALVSEVQWDTFGKHLIHVDFMRVDANEKVQVEVPVHLRGTAPGVIGGGVLEQPHHEVQVECLAVDIPKEIIIKVGELQIEDIVHVSDLTDIPSGVEILNPPDTILVQITKPREQEEPEPTEEGAAEPEVIGRKPDEEGEGGGDSN